MNKFLLKDSSGAKSVTMTAFVLGFVVVNAKLLASALTFGSYTMAAFNGSDYSMAMAALGAIYVLRRSSSKQEETNGDK